MYAKIFQSIYDGTLVEHWQALVTFEQMLILCDQDGILDMTPYAISRRTGIPIEIINSGIEVLEKPDINSRTSDEEGRRIIRIDPAKAWGWKVVNYEKYRDIRTAEERREYMRLYMRDRREKDKENQQPCKQESLQVNSGKPELALLAPQIHTQTHTQKKPIRSSGDDRFEDWWTGYPKKAKKKPARQIWKRQKLDGIADQLIQDVAMRLSSDRRWLDGFIPDPTTYLNQERWNDEIQRQHKPVAASAARTLPAGEKF